MSREKDPLKPFKDHGVEFIGTSGVSEQADCPFCGKPRSFHVTPETTKWICSSSPSRCGRSGNLVTFLSQWVEFCHQETGNALWSSLSAARGGLPIRAFKRHGLGFNPLNGNWLIPYWTDRGTIQDVRRWKPGKRMMGTSTCRVGLWNLPSLLDPKKASWPVDLCEGEWDGIALDWLIRKSLQKRIVVAVPGARVFKPEWFSLFKGRDVTWWYDHDSDGYEFSYKHSKTMADYARLQRFVCWPESFPEKADVRDFVVSRVIEDDVKPKTAYRQLRCLVERKHRKWQESDDAGTPKPEKRVRPKTNSTFAETLEVYSKWLKMSPDLVEALRAIYAVVLSNQIAGNPLWTFLVGPPGSGKTELLLSLQKVPDVFYRSSIGAKQLVSGFKQGKHDEDPSLIPKMLGQCVVFKDWTELLSGNQFELEATYGVLRGAYDGQIERSFGNGVERSYVGRFSILAGVTNKIHGQSEATVGERFLKFQLKALRFKQTQKLLADVIRGSVHEQERAHALQDAALKFLDRDIPQVEPEELLPDWAIERIAALSQLIAMLRAEVEYKREGLDRIVKYRPEAEVGTRLAQQLAKFAMALCFVDDKPRVDHDVYLLVERLAFNTGIGFNLELIEAMMEMGGQDIEIRELHEYSGVPMTGLRHRMSDMHMFGIVQPSKRAKAEHTPGRPPTYWNVSRNVSQLWRTIRPFQSHIEEAKAGRKENG